MITRRDALAKLAILTGSVAFGVATAKSDEDWLVGHDDARKLGINFEKLAVAGEYPNGFRSYREGNINVIVAGSEVFRRKWLAAHRHCVIERPKSRGRRVQVFRHYLYGEAL